MSPTLPLVAALSPLAAEHGVDLTPFALREMAFNDMMAAAIAHDDDAYNEAKARFENLGSDLRKPS